MSVWQSARRRATSINWRRRETILQAGALTAALALLLMAFLLRNWLSLSYVGYGGVALAALIGSAGFIVPAPGLAAVCTASAALDPLILGIVAGSAETIGELTGYLAGYSGQGFLSKWPIYHRLEGLVRRQGWAALFLVSVIPNPIFDFLGIAAGALRFPLWAFLLVVGAGKLIKFILFAFTCHYSIGWFVGLFTH